MSKNPTLIGLVSDTHGLLRVEALRALEPCELIVHAGDVGGPDIVHRLQRLAPVVAVRGNVDRGAWARGLPTTAVAKAGAVRIYVLHDLNHLELNPAAEGFPVVVSGHSHQPSHRVNSGVLYINPGSAGPKRFKLPATVARLDLNRVPWQVDFIDLERLDGR
jgi:uncharacterized protein